MATLINKKYIVIGGGGHARVLIDCLKLLNLPIIGCVDARKNSGDIVLDNINIIGDDTILDNYNPSDVLLVNGIGSVKDTKLRTDIYKKFKEKGFNFASLIHPAAFVSSYAQIKEGSVILAGAIICTNTYIGENVIINTKASIDHDCSIGSHSHIAPGVTLSGGVNVGMGSHLGTGSCIIQNCTIAEKILVGAGEVIKQDIIATRKNYS